MPASGAVDGGLCAVGAGGEVERGVGRYSSAVYRKENDMNKKGRPAGVKNDRGLYTIAVPKEIYDQIDDLAIGSGRSRTAVASFIFTEGLEHIQIVEETITRKRIAGIE
ncbi:TPA: hypothetical protein ACGOWW_000985 [Streptococcus suis]